jgi:Cytotoxic
VRVKPKTPRQHGGGLRRRWKDDDGLIYEWDYAHGNVEVYDPHGHHLGDMSYPERKPIDGPVRGRRVEP